MPKKIVCRYCGEQFAEKVGKPGFIDECPTCLHEKTTPKVPGRPAVELTPEGAERVKQFEQAVRSIRRQLAKLGHSPDKIDRLIRYLIDH